MISFITLAISIGEFKMFFWRGYQSMRFGIAGYATLMRPNKTQVAVYACHIALMIYAHA